MEDRGKPVAAAYQTRLTYGRHRQFQPRIRSSFRLRSRSDRRIAKPTSAAEDRYPNEPGQRSNRLLGPWDTDHSEPANPIPPPGEDIAIFSHRWKTRDVSGLVTTFGYHCGQKSQRLAC